MSDIAAKLDEARALIEKGWCQRAFELHSSQGACYCTMGAFYRALGELSEDDEETAFRTLIKAIGLPAEDTQVFEWNDAPERTQAEVIEAFRKAAELARSEQA